MVSARQLADVSEVQISEFQSNRESGAYIDTYDFDGHEGSDDDDVDEEDDLYDVDHDNNRVEDEDWEVAERGRPLILLYPTSAQLKRKISRSSIIVYVNTSKFGLGVSKARSRRLHLELWLLLYLRSISLVKLYLGL